MSSSVNANALWIVDTDRCELRDEILRDLEDGAVRVRMLYSGVSRGTERLVLQGKVPPSEAERMRGPHMGGDFPFPVKYGYAAVGRVEEGPSPLVGRVVFCLHPHQDMFIVPASAVTPLPEGLPAERGVLAANMETALNIVWDAKVTAGDRVCVFGAGVVGLLVAHLCAGMPGTEVTLVDPEASRRALADGFDLRFETPSSLDGEFDVLINASASDAALGQAINHAGSEARIVEASWHGEKPVTIPLGGAFHSRRLTLASSQVGSIPASHAARWDFSRRLAKALELLRDPRLDALISGESAFRDIETDYPAILADPATLCHRIRY